MLYIIHCDIKHPNGFNECCTAWRKATIDGFLTCHIELITTLLGH